MDSKTAGGVEVRRMEDGDLDQVLELYDLVFGESARKRVVERWEWAFGQGNLLPEDSPRWVLEDNGKITGYVASVPLPYWVNGQKVIAHTTADYMVHPDYRFHGINLMNEYFCSCPNNVFFDDMKATITVLRFLGAKQAGPVVRYVKVLDGRAIAARFDRPMIPPLWWPVTQGLRIRDWVRGRAAKSRVKVQPLTGFDERFDSFSLQQSKSIPVLTARDARYLSWRYGPGSPHEDAEIGAVFGSGNELVGYVVFRFSTERWPNGYILDLQVMPSANTDAATALLAYASDRLRARGAWMVRYHHLSTPHTLPNEVLERSGFVPRGSHQLMVKFGDDEFNKLGALQTNWNYSYGDSEESHSQA